MELKFFAATDVGRQREHNEDNFLVDKKLQLFVVADGMGGHAAGEVASQIAVHEVSRRGARERATSSSATRRSTTRHARQEILAVLEHAVQTACARSTTAARPSRTSAAWARPPSALLIAGDRGFIAHVGDSRIYLLRQARCTSSPRTTRWSTS